ncbi:MAG: galactose-1-phosphate uridylyltransferase [Elusimicrobia bacterium RIFOXYC2_FULL_34_12]|nr:MAG: galactose-1-phosphate uridylyltransferase [Elusimicrobia bacterium RIFOXYC2_FULL_34_12]
MPELRRDPIIGRWVIITKERGKVKKDFEQISEMDTSEGCPFCSGKENLTPPEILSFREPGTRKDEKGWWVRVIPNKFPVLRVEGNINRRGEGMFDYMDGIGAHEVIIETPKHDADFSDLDIKQAEEVVWAYRDRILDLKKDIRFEYILIFKNHGADAGASLSHPHSQIIAMPTIPVRVKQEIDGSRNYYEYKERCIFCDIIREETEANTRIVSENEDFICITPFASRFPFETWIMPKIHSSIFEDLSKHEVTNLALILRDINGRMNKTLEKPPYNFIIHNSPCRTGKIPYYHWHIEIMPRLTKVAGFEWGTGFYINPTPPEEAAKFLREID